MLAAERACCSLTQSWADPAGSVERDGYLIYCSLGQDPGFCKRGMRNKFLSWHRDRSIFSSAAHAQSQLRKEEAFSRLGCFLLRRGCLLLGQRQWTGWKQAACQIQLQGCPLDCTNIQTCWLILEVNLHIWSSCVVCM